MKILEEYIRKNEKILNRALVIDNEKWKENKSFKKIFDQIKFKIDLEASKTYLVIYDGDINITYELLKQAIKNKSNLILTLNDYYLVTNTILVGIARKHLEENNINIFIKLYNNINSKKVLESTQMVDYTIYIGNEDYFKNIEKKVKGKILKIEQ